MNPSCENFLSLAALGLLTRMREIARESNPPGYLRVGRKDLRPEDLLWSQDRAQLLPLLGELVDMGLIRVDEVQGRRRVRVVELLTEEELLEGSAVPTQLRNDGYREWAAAYQPGHEWSCPRLWDAALASGWNADRVVSVAKWYSLEVWRKNEKRMRPTEFFRRLPELEKQYLAATQEERDGKAVWQLEALSLFGKKSPDLSKESRAA